MMKTSISPGDVCRTTYCHEPIEVAVLREIPGSEPMPFSRDVLYEVQRLDNGERLLRRRHELEAKEKAALVANQNG